MAGIVIADAGPLIAFAAVDQLDLLRKLFGTVQVAESVRRECAAKPAADSHRIEQAVADGWLVEQAHIPDKDTAPSSLGTGEWSSIRLAERDPEDSLLILDDRLARRYAIARGLKVVGTVRLLVLAENQALIQDAANVIRQMRGHGYRISPQLLEQVRSSTRT